MAKNKSGGFGIVYSTDPNFLRNEVVNEEVSIEPAQQKLLVKLETKHRGGKAVTLLEGFLGTESDKQEIGRKLKTFCGTGGSVKDGEILIQGDNRDKVIQWLQKNGYKNVKRS